MERCFVGLGSNLNEPVEQLRRAILALAELPEIQLVTTSPFYSNRALSAGQPDYVNAVAELATDLEPETLLVRLQQVEQAQGRQRAEHWGARTLDLDLLLYGNRCIVTPRLELPHPRMLERTFVLRPLADIAPSLILPDGGSLQRRVDSCPDHTLVRLAL